MDSLLAPECIAMNVAAPTREAVFDEIARLVRRRYKLPERRGSLRTRSSFRQRLDGSGDASHVWRLLEQHMVK